MESETELNKGRDLEKEVLDRLDERRVTRAMTQVLFLKRTNKEPTKIYDSQTPYIFLQYIHLVMQWGSKKAGVNQRLMGLLLYLYPLGPFTAYQFSTMCKTVYMYQSKQLKKLIDKNLIVVWREKRKGEVKLYCLSAKAKNIISRMHTMCLGEEPFPETHRNPLKHSGTKIDKYYMDMMKLINKKEKEKRSESDSN